MAEHKHLVLRQVACIGPAKTTRFNVLASEKANTSLLEFGALEREANIDKGQLIYCGPSPAGWNDGFI